jgi:hypothetical protein
MLRPFDDQRGLMPATLFVLVVVTVIGVGVGIGIDVGMSLNHVDPDPDSDSVERRAQAKPIKTALRPRIARMDLLPAPIPFFFALSSVESGAPGSLAVLVT